MRYPTITPPTRAERKLIREKVIACIERRGSGTAAAEWIGISYSYLFMLRDKRDVNPGNEVLKKLGLRRVIYIEER